MDKIGSKPRSEIGGSLDGEETMRMRPSRRASQKASSVKPVPVSWMKRINCGTDGLRIILNSEGDERCSP